VSHIFHGFNACVFAYGQTGSGKTYTMYGPGGGAPSGPSHASLNNILPSSPGGISNEGQTILRASTRGIVPRCAEAIFAEAETRSPYADASVAVSLCEIYCDKIRDLGKAHAARGDKAQRAQAKLLKIKTSELHAAARTQAHGFGAGDPGSISSLYAMENLEMHEDARGQVYIKGMSIIPVQTVEEVMEVVTSSFKLRATHETKMNSVSSRSHTIFTFHITQKDRGTGQSTTAQLHLVDLAGSERLSQSESTGQRMLEAQSINLSLTCLGKVVIAIQQADPNEDRYSNHIPYRDSKLTRLLQGSLGGNAYASLIATVHPRQQDVVETLSTLQFANRCQMVMNRPKVNYLFPGAEDVAKRIRQLESEVAIIRYNFTRSRLSSAIRTMRLLAEAGVNGGILSDGRFKTEQGIIVGLTHAEAEVHPYVVRALSMLAPEPSEEDQDLYAQGQAVKAQMLTAVLAAQQNSARTRGGSVPAGAPMTDVAIERALDIAISGMATAGGLIGNGATQQQQQQPTGRRPKDLSAAPSSSSQGGGGGSNANSATGSITSGGSVMSGTGTVSATASVTANSAANTFTGPTLPSGAATTSSVVPQSINNFASTSAAGTLNSLSSTAAHTGAAGHHQQQQSSAINGVAAGTNNTIDISSTANSNGVSNSGRIQPQQQMQDLQQQHHHHHQQQHNHVHQQPVGEIQVLQVDSVTAPYSNQPGGNSGGVRRTNLQAFPSSSSAPSTAMPSSRSQHQYQQQQPVGFPSNGLASHESMGSLGSLSIDSSAPRGPIGSSSGGGGGGSLSGALSSGGGGAAIMAAKANAAYLANSSSLSPPSIMGGGGGGVETKSVNPLTLNVPFTAGSNKLGNNLAGSRLGQAISVSPEEYQAEIAKLKSRVSELKKELDEKMDRYTKEQTWLKQLAKEAQEKGAKAQAEAAEAIRSMKDKNTKMLDEHNRQVHILLDNSNRLVEHQERLALSTPRHAIPSLLKEAGIEVQIVPPSGSLSPRLAGSAGGGGGRGGKEAWGPGDVAIVSVPTLGRPQTAASYGGDEIISSAEFDAHRKEYNDAVARLKLAHEAEIRKIRKHYEDEIAARDLAAKQAAEVYKDKMDSRKREAVELRAQIAELKTHVTFLEKEVSRADGDQTARHMGVDISQGRAPPISGSTLRPTTTSSNSSRGNGGNGSTSSRPSTVPALQIPQSPLRPQSKSGVEWSQQDSNAADAFASITALTQRQRGSYDNGRESSRLMIPVKQSVLNSMNAVRAATRSGALGLEDGDVIPPIDVPLNRDGLPLSAFAQATR
jgi:hypothetical protein